jgi:phosphoribosylaminoimidazole-succinocarboxamide synthase
VETPARPTVTENRPAVDDARTEPPDDPALARLEPLARGKVRHLYRIDAERLLMVASDRLSAFDVVFPTPVPGKGRVLTTLSRFWFRKTAALVPNHLLEEEPASVLGENVPRWLLERSLVVRRLEPLPLEAVVRARLAGSAWAEYRRTGRAGGHPLPAGLRLGDALPTPLFTPSWKAPAGEHDRPVDEAEYTRLAGGPERAQRIRNLSLLLFEHAARHAAARGVVLADTKFEFGLDRAGEVVLIDEILTPDSSRYWEAARIVPGTEPPSYDKQPVRNYLESLGWNKKPPPPPLPPAILADLARRYEEITTRLTAPDSPRAHGR